jgi:hypothetical protein
VWLGGGGGRYWCETACSRSIWIIYACAFLFVDVDENIGPGWSGLRRLFSATCNGSELGSCHLCRKAGVFMTPAVDLRPHTLLGHTQWGKGPRNANAWFVKDYPTTRAPKTSRTELPRSWRWPAAWIEGVQDIGCSAPIDGDVYDKVLPIRWLRHCDTWSLGSFACLYMRRLFGIGAGGVLDHF